MPDWSDVLKEINQEREEHLRLARGAVDTIRRRYLDQLFQYTGRNIIAYYSGFLSKPGIAQSEITDEDMNGFMMAVHNLDRSKGLDLFLHTPGGSIAATEAIVSYLHKMFGDDIRAIVPQIAMSAGTMVACSCREIVMAKHASLGPIDPHLNGRPAYGILEEFERAKNEVAADQSIATMWHAIISQYHPTLLGQCTNAIAWSEEFVRDQLAAVMFKAESNPQQAARAVVTHLTDFTGNKSHSRHIDYDECLNVVGLRVTALEADPALQDLALTIHHCFMHTLMNTNAFKIIENHLGAALVKQEQVIQVVQ